MTKQKLVYLACISCSWPAQEIYGCRFACYTHLVACHSYQNLGNVFVVCSINMVSLAKYSCRQLIVRLSYHLNYVSMLHCKTISVVTLLVTAASSYVHFHSLDGSLRTVATIIRMVVDVRGYATHSTTTRWARGAPNSGCWLLAIIEGLDHATSIWTCLR